MVDNYYFQKDKTFDSFIINFNNKTRYKINRLNLFPIRDDFKRLVKDFSRLSNQYKIALKSDTEMKLIKEGVSIYASKSFRWIFYLFIAGFLLLVIAKVLNSVH